MTQNFDDLTSQYLKRHFDCFDRDKIGRVPLSDLPNLVRICGGTPAEDDLEPLKAEADQDGRGSMNFNGFCRAMYLAYTKIKRPREVRDAFHGLDADKKGLISQDELRFLLTSLGDCFSIEEMNEFVEEMRSEMDMEGNLAYNDMVYKMTPEMFR